MRNVKLKMPIDNTKFAADKAENYWRTKQANQYEAVLFDLMKPTFFGLLRGRTREQAQEYLRVNRDADLLLVEHDAFEAMANTMANLSALCLKFKHNGIREVEVTGEVLQVLLQGLAD